MKVYSDLTNEVASGGGYATGGNTLGGRTSAFSTLDATLDATDIQWTSATFTCAYAAVYETTGGKIRAIYDLGGSKTVTNGTLTLVWNTSGLLSVTSV